MQNKICRGFLISKQPLSALRARCPALDFTGFV